MEITKLTEELRIEKNERYYRIIKETKKDMREASLTPIEDLVGVSKNVSVYNKKHNYVICLERETNSFETTGSEIISSFWADTEEEADLILHYFEKELEKKDTEMLNNN